MKFVSIVTPCYNEEENARGLYEEIKKIIASLSGYAYEHIFIDNASKDNTVKILKEIAAADKNVKIIVNCRNFGHIRSPFYGILQSSGEATINIAADFQDPPELIKDFIRKWEEGYKIVVGVKTKSDENAIIFAIRKSYYKLIKRFADTEQIENFMGFGLYDREFIEILRKLNDPYPYFRGLITDIGLQRTEIPYVQPKRKRGATKNNFYTLYDIAMLGITNHSKVPLRLATILGFTFSVINLLVAAGYFLYKLIRWDLLTIGTAPIIIGLFFFASVQLFFLGIIGEYVGSIHTQVLKRPLVIEKERINF